MTRAIVLLVAIGVLACPARADVVFGAPCPPGSRGRPSHQGPHCEPWTCETDADCARAGGPETCQEASVCVGTQRVAVWNRMTGEQSVVEAEMVVSRCETEPACRHEGWPEIPTVGEPTGTATCRTARYCIAPPLPSLPEVARPVVASPSTTAPSVSSVPSTGVTAPVPAASGCACAMHARRPPGPAAWLVALVLAVLARRRVLLGALLVGIGVAGSASAQSLPPGWRRVPIDPPWTFAITDVACTRDRAFVRNRAGVVFSWDGERWSRFPAPVAHPSEYANGEALWATPDGQLFVDVDGALYHWDHHAWQPVPLDPFFRAAPASITCVTAFGDAPWILARGAIGAPIDGTVRAFGIGSAADIGPVWWSTNGLAVLAPDDVRIASASGVLRWDGHAWRHEGPAVDLVGITAFGADDVWAWGTRVIHWNGHAWQPADEGFAACGVDQAYSRPSDDALSIGGRRDVVVATSLDRVCRHDAHGWSVVMDRSALADPEHHFGHACATDRQLVVAETGNALVLDLAP